MEKRLEEFADEVAVILRQLVTKRYRDFTVRVESRAKKRSAGHCNLKGEIVLYLSPHEDIGALFVTACHELAHHVAMTRWKNRQMKQYGWVVSFGKPYHGLRWRRQLERICHKFNLLFYERLGGMMMVFPRKTSKYGHHDSCPTFVVGCPNPQDITATIFIFNALILSAVRTGEVDTGG